MEIISLLKTIKLYESTISMILGAIVLSIAVFLVFSYFRNLKVGETSKTAVQNESSQGVSHIVQEGETLWNISEKYYESGFDWKKIADANSITNPSSIEKDTVLIIPDVHASEKTSTTEDNSFIQTSTTINDGIIQENTYTVTKGDSLWNIAVRAYGDGYRWTDIVRANNIENPNIIYPSTILNLPK